MSRGPGRVERRVIEILAASPFLPVTKIAWWVAGTGSPASPSTRASVSRALGRLKKKGVVLHLGRRWLLTATHLRRTQAQRKAKEAADAKQRAEAFQRERLREQQERRERAGDIGRLVALLGMLGSDYDGEVLNAARAVEAARHKIGKTWADLIRRDDSAPF